VLARQEALTSPRFVGEPLLEACFEDRARMGVGARDSDVNQPVSKVQQALVDLGFNLGTSGPGGNGVDGIYGQRTAAAVRAFKVRESLGSEQFGDVGPGTMHRLNELFPPSPTPPGPTPPGPAPPVPPRVVLMAPSGTELWWFDGQSPTGYPVQIPLEAASGGRAGTFRWRVVRGAAIADFAGSSTATGRRVNLVSKGPSAALRDVAVQVTFTGTDGTGGAASFPFTVQAPQSMTRLGTTTTNNAPNSYLSLISYSIQDQFGRTLPRNVPINEQWDNKPPIPDFAGTNWPSPTEGSANVNPAGWSDQVGISTTTPALMVPPILASGGALVMHFAGHWQVGSRTTGSGRRALNTTWQFFQDRGAHV
jgi:peptidoglycan hydrolase-like protein with peptidoglycan-binding domain